MRVPRKGAALVLATGNFVRAAPARCRPPPNAPRWTSRSARSSGAPGGGWQRPRRREGLPHLGVLGDVARDADGGRGDRIAGVVDHVVDGAGAEFDGEDVVQAHARPGGYLEAAAGVQAGVDVGEDVAAAAPEFVPADGVGDLVRGPAERVAVAPGCLVGRVVRQ